MADQKRHTLLGYLAGALYRLYSTTWSYRVSFPDGSAPIDLWTKTPGRSCVFGHWHGDELALIGFCRYAKYLALSSQSKDGSIMAAALKVMGLDVARGSSSRGGTRALVSMIRMVKNNHYYVSFAVDGPTGPRHKAKPGIHLFASKSDLPIYQCVTRCDRKWDIPNTWNKTYLPKPFAKISLYFYELPKATKTNRDTILSLFDSRTGPDEENT
jgi:lysophospholipid acyltransferase (LPLAT)-like uncharacterized protein